MTTNLKSVTILIPGGMHERSVARIGDTFTMLRTKSIDANKLSTSEREAVRGIAVSPAIAGGRVAGDYLEAFPNLEIVANFGVGYDGVDAAYAGQHNIMVTNTPDVLTEEVADTAVGLLLNTVRELSRAEAYLRQGFWATKGNFQLSRASLQGRSVGIFGMGRIGQAIARRLEAFGLPIAYHNRRKVEGLAYDHYPTLTGLAEAVDTLISVAPGGASTANAVNAEVLSALGPDGVFVNIGRGSVVDEAALATALKEGTILAAGLDVFADEPNVPQALLDAPNATLLPHVGSASVRTRNAMADLVVDNLISWFDEGKALTAVPETAGVQPK
jgi:lactate dehydrogenase-like 2-hydroxyacid dehydrogenase